MAKPMKYPGHFVTKSGQELSFNLYQHDDIKFEPTRKNLLDSMKRNHLAPMKKLFAEAGLNLQRFEFFSPKAYNYEGDSIDLVLSIGSKDKLIKYVKENAKGIQSLLSGNKSYDGYMALTADSVEDVIDKIKTKSDPDPMVVAYILTKYPLDEYDDFFDLLIQDDEGEN